MANNSRPGRNEKKEKEKEKEIYLENNKCQVKMDHSGNLTITNLTDCHEFQLNKLDLNNIRIITNYINKKGDI